MGKRYRSVVMKTSEQNMAIKAAEAWKVGGTGAAKRLWVQVEEMSLNQIGCHLIPGTVHLHDRNGRTDKLTLNGSSSDIGRRIGLHHPFHDHLIFHFGIFQ